MHMVYYIVLQLKSSLIHLESSLIQLESSRIQSKNSLIQSALLLIEFMSIWHSIQFSRVEYSPTHQPLQFSRIYM